MFCVRLPRASGSITEAVWLGRFETGKIEGRAKPELACDHQSAPNQIQSHLAQDYFAALNLSHVRITDVHGVVDLG